MLKQEMTEYVKSIYPDMIEDYWFSFGELHFYTDEKHKERSELYASDSVYCYVKEDGEFRIYKEF